MELPEEVYDKITSLSDEGDLFLEQEKTEDAIVKYNEALALVPNPKTDWEASTWLYATLGDCYFMQEVYEKSLHYFLDAYNCPNGTNNRFINLRIGENYFELDDYKKAKEFLLRAYMLEGKPIFDDEKEDYMNLIKEII